MTALSIQLGLGLGMILGLVILVGVPALILAAKLLTAQHDHKLKQEINNVF